MMKELKGKITIGRSSKNRIQIQNASVSSNHCIIERMSENSFLIVDCGSTNGTKVNGRKIRSKIITKEDKLTLGAFIFKLEKLYPSISDPPKDEFVEQFKLLEEVWDNYQQSKALIITKDNTKKTWIRAASILIPFVGNAIGMALTANITPYEKMQALRNKFMVSYLCPKCKVFLGEFPYKGLKKQAQCRYCKVKWV